MHLRVRGPDTQLELDDVSPSWTVQMLRAAVASRLTPAVEPSRVKLILMGRVLHDDSQTLEDLHLENDHVVHMVIRAEGISPSPAPQPESTVPQPRMATVNVFSVDGNTATAPATDGGLGGLIAGLLGPQGGFSSPFVSLFQQTPSANEIPPNAQQRAPNNQSAGGSAEPPQQQNNQPPFFAQFHHHAFNPHHHHAAMHHHFAHMRHQQAPQQQQQDPRSNATSTHNMNGGGNNNTNVTGVQLHLHVSLAELDQVPAALQRLNTNLASPVDVRVTANPAASTVNSAANAAAAASAASRPATTTTNQSTSNGPRASSQPRTQTSQAPRAPSANAGRKTPNPGQLSTRTPSVSESLLKAAGTTVNACFRMPHDVLEIMSGQYGSLIRNHGEIRKMILGELSAFASSSAGIRAVGANADPSSPKVRHAWMMAVSHDVVEEGLLKTRVPTTTGEAPLAALFLNTTPKPSWPSDQHVLACLRRAVYLFLEKVALEKFADVAELTLTNHQAWAQQLHEACVISVGRIVNFLGDEYFQNGPGESAHAFNACMSTLAPRVLRALSQAAVQFEELIVGFLVKNIMFWAEEYKVDRQRNKAADYEEFKRDRPAPQSQVLSSSVTSPTSSNAIAAALHTTAPVASPSSSSPAVQNDPESILNAALVEAEPAPAPRSPTPPGEKRPRE